MKIFGKEFSLGAKKIGRSRFNFPAFSREEIAFIATIFSFFSLIAIIVWDGYIFYASAQKKLSSDIGANPARLVTEKQIQDVIKALDDREKKLNEILGK